jgi:hypothetical protein
MYLRSGVAGGDKVIAWAKEEMVLESDWHLDACAPRHDSWPAGPVDIIRLRRRANRVLPAVLNHGAVPVPPRPQHRV